MLRFSRVSSALKRESTHYREQLKPLRVSTTEAVRNRRRAATRLNVSANNVDDQTANS